MYQERLLPHNIEAEEAVIGSLLIDGDALFVLSSPLLPDDFYREKNRICFAAILRLHQAGRKVDQLTLAGDLALRDELEIVGGMAYLSHLVAITPTSAHIDDYAAIVSRAATMRRLIEAGNRIVTLGYDNSEDVDTALNGAEAAITAVRGAGTPAGYISIREFYDGFLSQSPQDMEGPEAGIPLMTSFYGLDHLLNGLKRSNLLILGARPSMGKTTLAMNLAVNAARDGHVGLIFSMEMSVDEICLRILSAEARVPFRIISSRLYTDYEEGEIISAIGRLSDLPLYIDSTGSLPMSEMRRKCRRLAMERGLDFVVVDYLQLMRGEGRGRQQVNRVQEVSDISRELKILASDFSIPVLVCSQLSRVVESRVGHRPILSDLRDSGSIEQDADVVMFIHREDYYTSADEWRSQRPGQPYPRNIAEIIVAKHRSGPTGTAELLFDGQFFRFHESRAGG